MLIPDADLDARIMAARKAAYEQGREEAATRLAELEAENARLHELLFESLYHLRIDDGAKAYHERVLAVRQSLGEPKP